MAPVAPSLYISLSHRERKKKSFVAGDRLTFILSSICHCKVDYHKICSFLNKHCRTISSSFRKKTFACLCVGSFLSVSFNDTALCVCMGVPHRHYSAPLRHRQKKRRQQNRRRTTALWQESGNRDIRSFKKIISSSSLVFFSSSSSFCVFTYALHYLTFCLEYLITFTST